MASSIYKYENVSYSSISSYVSLQSNGGPGASTLADIKNQINGALDSEVKKKVLDALQKIQTDSSLKGSISSLKKNLKQLDNAMDLFPDYRKYLRKYENTSDEDKEEEYKRKAKQKLEAIDNRLE